jgi:hypothetical protein
VHQIRGAASAVGDGCDPDVRAGERADVVELQARERRRVNRCQLVPLKCSIALSGATVPPTAQMLVADSALARSRPTALPLVHCCQVVPL